MVYWSQTSRSIEEASEGADSCFKGFFPRTQALSTFMLPSSHVTWVLELASHLTVSDLCSRKKKRQIRDRNLRRHLPETMFP